MQNAFAHGESAFVIADPASGPKHDWAAAARRDSQAIVESRPRDGDEAVGGSKIRGQQFTGASTMILASIVFTCLGVTTLWTFALCHAASRSMPGPMRALPGAGHEERAASPWKPETPGHN